MKIPLILGNWKMHLVVSEAIELAKEIRDGFSLNNKVQAGVFPPFPFLGEVAKVLKGSPIGWGAQNMHYQDEGAFTGEVSAKMLHSLGCHYVILGHSERRQYFGETDELVGKKVASALSFHLQPVVCVGESLKERQEGRAKEVVEKQIRQSLSGFGSGVLASLILAYEPVWAIGTGQAATAEDAEEMHLHILNVCSHLFGADFASKLTVLYGGSVKPENAYDLGKMAHIHGALVGGASLKASSFLEIIEQMAKAKQEIQ